MPKREFGRVAGERGGRTPSRKPRGNTRMRPSEDANAPGTKRGGGRFADFGGNFDGKGRKYPGGSNQFSGH